MQLILDTSSIEDYRLFLRIKELPSYRIHGCVAAFPDEYASRLGLVAESPQEIDYHPKSFLFDYQADIARLAIRKRRFCMFAACGLGKTLIFLEYARTVLPMLSGRGGLMFSPAMVIGQTIEECRKFYGDEIPIEHVKANELQDWMDNCEGKLGITNYEAIKPTLTRGKVGMMIMDESAVLKDHYAKWGTKCIELGKGLEWKLAGTGLPAPNDRIEYANHALLMDEFPTVNSFLAKFFVNRGQTGARWELKDHAVKPFFNSLSHWSIFLNDPATYGWKDNVQGSIPPIHVHLHDVSLTKEQEDLAFKKQGVLFATSLGGIASRASYGQIAKGSYKGKRISTEKPAYIRRLVESWPEESTIIWCIYNAEQARIEEELPGAASIKGTSSMAERIGLIGEFQSGQRKVLISKPRILGYGLNLQVATRQIFSGLQDSLESFHQAVKRSNRVGSTRPLNVHIPLTDVERPMVENVLQKCKRVQYDTEQQEGLFKQQFATGRDSEVVAGGIHG